MAKIKKAFERGLKAKLRFTSTKGPLTIEDLYDLTLTGRGVNLNDLGKGIKKILRESEDDNIVEDVTVAEDKERALNELRLEIILIIIEEKVKARDIAAKATETRAKKQKILGLIARKEDEVDGAKTLEELKAELDSL